jgi:hypothetical protein
MKITASIKALDLETKKTANLTNEDESAGEVHSLKVFIPICPVKTGLILGSSS